MISESIHQELRPFLRHLEGRLLSHYGFSDAGLSELRAFVMWMDDTPEARRAMRTLGVVWRRQAPRKSNKR